MQIGKHVRFKQGNRLGDVHGAFATLKNRENFEKRNDKPVIYVEKVRVLVRLKITRFRSLNYEW